jgi:hypothetical protein
MAAQQAEWIRQMEEARLAWEKQLADEQAKLTPEEPIETP